MSTVHCRVAGASLSRPFRRAEEHLHPSLKEASRAQDSPLGCSMCHCGVAALVQGGQVGAAVGGFRCLEFSSFRLASRSCDAVMLAPSSPGSAQVQSVLVTHLIIHLLPHRVDDPGFCTPRPWKISHALPGLPVMLSPDRAAAPGGMPDQTLTRQGHRALCQGHPPFVLLVRSLGLTVGSAHGGGPSLHIAG